MPRQPAWREEDAAADPVGVARPGRAVLPGRDFPTNLGQMHRAAQHHTYAGIGQVVDGFWAIALRPLRAARGRLGLSGPPVSPTAPPPTWEELVRGRERRRRADRLVAVGSGVAVGLAVFWLADSLPERSSAAVLGRQGWWLAGAFWAGFTLLVRQWLDQ